MKIAFLTPGAGNMYCGGCLHDGTLVAALNKLGHNAIILPLYLPLKLEDSTDDTPLFFNGVNVYLDQKSALFRLLPCPIRRLFSSKQLLKIASALSSTTDADSVGDIAVSMLQGEEGKQSRELEELVGWLEKNFKPDLVCISNSLLIGMAKKIRERLKCPIVCQFQGEDTYISSMPSIYRSMVWSLIEEKTKDVDLFIVPSRYASTALKRHVLLTNEKIEVVYNGINTEEFQNVSGLHKSDKEPTVIGYFARMCEEKGLHLLIDAFLELKNRNGSRKLKLEIGGTLLPKDGKYVNNLKQKIEYAGYLDDVEFHPNVGKKEKINFYNSIDIFCVPAVYSEVFGLYTIEAMAAGVPLVLPRHGSFVEIVEETSTGILYAPNTLEHLYDALNKIIIYKTIYSNYQKTCIPVARQRFDSLVMAKNFISAIEPLVKI